MGIRPTSASWTNSPPPHLSILWDDHITGMITSTSWDDHISCARQDIVEHSLLYDIPSARRWPRSEDLKREGYLSYSVPQDPMLQHHINLIVPVLQEVPLVKADDEVAPPSNRKDSESGVLVPLPLPRVTPEMCHGGRAAPPAEQCQPRAKGNKEHNKFLAKASAALAGEGCGKGSRGSYRVVTPLSMMHTGCMTMMMMGRHMVLGSVL